MEQLPQRSFDPSIIRTPIRVEEIKFRGQGASSEELKVIKKALLTFHDLETMAANVYKFQMTKEGSELNRQLLAAMCNEMTHIEDFQVKLYEYGWRPNKFRWAFWVVGFVIGFTSRLGGPSSILRAARWVETKAVQHYGKLLLSIDWDEETRAVIEKDRSDEIGHVNRWESLLQSI